MKRTKQTKPVWSYSKDEGLTLDHNIKLLIFDCDGTLMDTLAIGQNDGIADQLSLVKPIPEILAIATTFYGKLPMAVASGGDSYSVNKMLSNNEIIHLFDTVVTINDVAPHCGKPAPDIFLTALEQIGNGILPQECLVFEDSDAGFMAACNAKMHFASVHEILRYHQG